MGYTVAPDGSLTFNNTPSTTADLQKLSDRVEQVSNNAADTATALPDDGNWPGRLMLVKDTGIVYVNAAGDSTWEKLSDADDTGWISITSFSNSWHAETGYPVAVRRKNGAVYWQGELAGGSTNPAILIPPGFRPFVPTTGAWFQVANGPSAATTTRLAILAATPTYLSAISGATPNLAMVSWIAES